MSWFPSGGGTGKIVDVNGEKYVPIVLPFTGRMTPEITDSISAITYCKDFIFYIAYTGSNSRLFKADKTTLETIAQITLPTQAYSVISNENNLFVTAIDKIYAYDPITLAKVFESTALGNTIEGITANEEYLYTSMSSIYKVFRLDAKTLTKITESPTLAESPRQISVDGNALYGLLYSSRKVASLNAITLAKLGETVAYPNTLSSLAVVGGNLFVTDSVSRSVIMLSSTTLSNVTTYTFPVGDAPTQLTTDGFALYVYMTVSRTVSLFLGANLAYLGKTANTLGTVNLFIASNNLLFGIGGKRVFSFNDIAQTVGLQRQ